MSHHLIKDGEYLVVVKNAREVVNINENEYKVIKGDKNERFIIIDKVKYPVIKNPEGNSVVGILNIDKYPSLDTDHLAIEGHQISLGDLHGNAQKLLYTLTRHGFIDIAADDYAALAKLYRKKPLDKKDIKDFNTLLNNIKVRPQAKKSLLRLIGDVLADRGMNDYFTLKLLKLLRDNGVPFINLISNHDAEFIKPDEKGMRFDTSGLGPQAVSAANLQKLLDLKIVTQSELKELIEAYKPSLRALDYSLNEENKITIYSHGVIGLDNINYIAAALGMQNVNCNEKTPGVEIAQVIDEINTRFAKHVENNTVTDLLQLDKVDINAINGITPIDPIKFPFAHLVWNRKADGLKRPLHIDFVHGHDKKDVTINNIYNLDNDLGKGSYHTGIYNVLHSNETTLRAELTSTDAEIVMPVPKPTLNVIEDYQPKPITKIVPPSNEKSFDEELEQEWEKLDATPDVVAPTSVPTGWFSGLANWWWGSNKQSEPNTPVKKVGYQQDQNIIDAYGLKEGEVVVDRYGFPITVPDMSKSCMIVPASTLTFAYKELQSQKVKDFYGAKSGEVAVDKLGNPLQVTDISQSFRIVPISTLTNETQSRPILVNK